MKKHLLLLSAVMSSAAMLTAQTNDQGVLKVVLEEDFSLLTLGSEGNPASVDLADDNNRVPDSKTHTPGWMGYFIHEAGGMLYIGYDSKQIDTGVISTPKMDLTAAGGAFTVKFRARSAVNSSNEKIYIDSKQSVEVSTSAEVKVTGQWADYEVKFENGVEQSYIMLMPWLDPVYIDDIRVEMLIPYVAAPKNLEFSNYTGTGFTAKWDAVDKARHYLLSVYTKNSAGERDYYIEDKVIEGLSYELANLPQKDSFYYFIVKAYDGEHTSPESVETAVEALLRPVIKAETEVSANGFTANWEPVSHADNYHFITRRQHTATAPEEFSYIKEGFENIEPLSSSYDYTSIPELPGWTIASPVFKAGEIGINSSNGQYGSDAWIQSSIYDFSNGEGNVRIKMSAYGDYKKDKYKSDILIGLYTYSEADKRYRVTDYKEFKQVGNDGVEIDIVLTGGGKQSLLMIEPDGYAKIMIRSLEVSQALPTGASTEFTIVSKSSTETSVKVENIKFAEGDKIHYTVRAVGRNSTDTGNIYSDYTEPTYVTFASAGIDDITTDIATSYTVYNLMGIKVLETADYDRVKALPKGIYIVNGKKVAIR